MNTSTTPSDSKGILQSSSHDRPHSFLDTAFRFFVWSVAFFSTALVFLRQYVVRGGILGLRNNLIELSKLIRTMENAAVITGTLAITLQLFFLMRKTNFPAWKRVVFAALGGAFTPNIIIAASSSMETTSRTVVLFGIIIGLFLAFQSTLLFAPHAKGLFAKIVCFVLAITVGSSFVLWLFRLVAMVKKSSPAMFHPADAIFRYTGEVGIWLSALVLLFWLAKRSKWRTPLSIIATIGALLGFLTWFALSVVVPLGSESVRLSELLIYASHHLLSLKGMPLQSLHFIAYGAFLLAFVFFTLFRRHEMIALGALMFIAAPFQPSKLPDVVPTLLALLLITPRLGLIPEREGLDITS